MPRPGGGLGEIEDRAGTCSGSKGAYIAVGQGVPRHWRDVEALYGELVERKQRLEIPVNWRSSWRKWPRDPSRVLCGEGWHVLLYQPLQQGLAAHGLGNRCGRKGAELMVLAMAACRWWS